MIELREVVKKFGSRCALDGITVQIPKGKVIGLVGENGSGKTTLLKLIAGLLTPDAGQALIHQKPITRKVASEIAYMADTDLYYPYFTVGQLIDFYETQFQDFDSIKAKEIAQYLELTLDAKMKDLSKGSRGRAKIAVTLGRNVDYYLLDEPFSGLDPMVRTAIAKGLIQFVDTTSQTVLLSTHEIKEVEPLLDELLVLKGSRMLAHEAVDDIRDQYGMDATSWMVSLFQKGGEVG